RCSRSRCPSRGACATARSATPRATWSGSRRPDPSWSDDDLGRVRRRRTGAGRVRGGAAAGGAVVSGDGAGERRAAGSPGHADLHRRRALPVHGAHVTKGCRPARARLVRPPQRRAGRRRDGRRGVGERHRATRRRRGQAGDGRRRRQLRPRRPLRPVRAATDRGAVQRLRRRHAARASTVARRRTLIPSDGDTMSRAMSTRTHPPALHVADRHELIRVHGARVNNLKDGNVEIPKRRLTVFTSVSGSGKSSLVFDTIAAESQRLINETYSAFVQGFMPTLARPEVDVLEGLTTAIVVDQERMGSNPRSTVGTGTDANAMLRILFSRLGKPHIGSPNAYSFNVPSVRASG